MESKPGPGLRKGRGGDLPTATPLPIPLFPTPFLPRVPPGAAPISPAEGSRDPCVPGAAGRRAQGRGGRDQRVSVSPPAVQGPGQRLGVQFPGRNLGSGLQRPQTLAVSPGHLRGPRVRGGKGEEVDPCWPLPAPAFLAFVPFSAVRSLLSAHFTERKAGLGVSVFRHRTPSAIPQESGWRPPVPGVPVKMEMQDSSSWRILPDWVWEGSEVHSFIVLQLPTFRASRDLCPRHTSWKNLAAAGFEQRAIGLSSALAQVPLGQGCGQLRAGRAEEGREGGRARCWLPAAARHLPWSLPTPQDVPGGQGPWLPIHR